MRKQWVLAGHSLNKALIFLALLLRSVLEKEKKLAAFR